ncbi:hypothetical protein RND71_014615 [Anisodus tanguticus]|uniref:Uncharacterized protein n=1 Tax=Anisodus tanguticus TaxID=243964 RepID=A0AAE1SAZ3_9SOLA|nr:hypothetical protein RND71_014615 [Anisodus tanguticus]
MTSSLELIQLLRLQLNQIQHKTEEKRRGLHRCSQKKKIGQQIKSSPDKRKPSKIELNLILPMYTLFTLQMPADKKPTVPSSCFLKRKRHYSTERASKIKPRRHDLYTQLSVDKKEMILSERRAKNLESISGSLFVDRA